MAAKIERRPVGDHENAECSCCGSEGTHSRPVFHARIVDTDGEFYPRLCGSCFDDVEKEIFELAERKEAAIAAGLTPPHDFGAARREAARVLAASGALDGDDDGFQVMVEDHGDEFFGDDAGQVA